MAIPKYHKDTKEKTKNEWEYPKISFAFTLGHLSKHVHLNCYFLTAIGKSTAHTNELHAFLLLLSWALMCHFSGGEQGRSTNILNTKCDCEFNIVVMATIRWIVQLHKDVPKAARFYSDGLGLSLHVCTLNWAELQSGPLKLALLRAPRYTSFPCSHMKSFH